MDGYLHSAYAQSLLDHGEIIFLPHSKGWILKRRIPNFDYYDGMGIYPLFICENWEGLSEDIEEIKNELVCFSIVTDPFGKFNKNILIREFTDVFSPFKNHFVIDLSQPFDKYISRHHRRNIKKAQRKIFVEKCELSRSIVDDWIKLYKHLIRIHNIRGIPAFSEKALSRQLEVPGAQIFRGIYGGETIAMLVWYIDNNIGYYHLGASSELGYRLKASFALFQQSIEYFYNIGLEWLNLGAGPGTDGKKASGLTRFKKGWSSGTRTTYFCGKIFDRLKYAEIIRKKNILNGNYFPAYRSDEFK